MKKKIIALCIFFSMLAALSAEVQIVTRVGVLDYGRVLSTFYKDSQAVRNLEASKSQFQKESQAYQDEIALLEQRKLKAENSGNNALALELDNQIFEKKAFLGDFIRVKNAQLSQMNRSLTQNNALVKEITEVIQDIAESGGYSMILKKDDPSILWWNYDTDITDQVLQRLMKKKR